MFERNLLARQLQRDRDEPVRGRGAEGELNGGRGLIRQVRSYRTMEAAAGARIRDLELGVRLGVSARSETDVADPSWT
jgi:hypothetical protein